MYERLLAACKQVWGSGTRLEILDAVLEVLDRSEYGQDTVLTDTLSNNFNYIFSDTEGWLSINRNPLQASFALKELFEFEATNFSSARTHRRPVVVSCFDKEKGKKPIYRIKDVYVSGELFGGMVQVIQNILQNAFQYCALPIRQIEIDVSILDCGGGHVEIEVRNAFSPEKRGEMRHRVNQFNLMVSQARTAAKANVDGAPLQVGGSGLKRIYFDLYDHLGEDFWLLAKGDEINRDRFLVCCGLRTKMEGE